MARGWESKSVEEQVAEKEHVLDARDARPEAAAEAERKRKRQMLELQRERILDERTSNPHRRAALEAALADIESKLAAIP
jgi:L-alanine-DL-glutamate epimerase-like enolase superfamily enzyme